MTPGPGRRGELRPGPDRERALELLLLGLVAVVAGVTGMPQVVQSLQAGSVELATVFYPVLLAAFVGLGWSRRRGA